MSRQTMAASRPLVSTELLASHAVAVLVLGDGSAPGTADRLKEVFDDLCGQAHTIRVAFLHLALASDALEPASEEAEKTHLGNEQCSSTSLNTLLETLASSPQLIIGVATGPVSCAGTCMLAACDSVIALGGSDFALSDGGALPSTWLISRMGTAALDYYHTSGSQMTAAAAHQLGFVAELAQNVEALWLREEVLTAELAAQAPQSMPRVKAAMRARSYTPAAAVASSSTPAVGDAAADSAKCSDSAAVEVPVSSSRQIARGQPRQEKQQAQAGSPRSPRRREGVSIRPATPTSIHPITSFMIHHIPRSVTQGQLEQAIQQVGFTGKYNALFLPMVNHHAKGHVNFGHAFVNFPNPEDAKRFQELFPGYRFMTNGKEGENEMSYAPAQALSEAPECSSTQGGAQFCEAQELFHGMSFAL